MTHPYASRAYAESLAHVGAALAVPAWDGQVLVRPTPDGSGCDAMGPYPLTAIPRDADLAGGLETLGAAGLVSVVLVADDRLRPSLESLGRAFDVARPFKSHFLHDRSLGPVAYAKHHRYELKRALARVEAREIVLADHLPAWTALYGELAGRHGLAGLHAFPAAHHEALARLPGLRAFGAFTDSGLVSAHLFVTHDGYAVSHLAASAPEGYATGAAYAVNDLAIAALTDCETINFGGGAGFGDDPNDGLVRFKRGFSNRTAPAFLCGKVLDPAAYEMLSRGFARTGFFPAYRGALAQEPADAHQG
jgi:hypothetical protein